MGDKINNDKNTLVNAFKRICGIEFPQDGVKFHLDTIRTSDITVDKKYPGINITLTATLDSIKQDVSLDIGFGDIITPSPVELGYPTLLEDVNGFPLQVYSLETVIAEKFQTVIERGSSNSRMKDFYDLYTILKNHQLDPSLLQEAISATFVNRHTAYQPDNVFFSKEFAEDESLKKRWFAYMKIINPPYKPSFEEIVTFIQVNLESYWEGVK